MVAALDSHTYESGARIINEGDPGELFYIIKMGTVSCTAGGNEVSRFSKGDFFGEMALLYSQPRTATVTALSETKCVSLGRESLQAILGGDL